MFAALMALQWAAGIPAAIWFSPYVWAGADSQIHQHVWAAIFLGSAISSLPIYLTFTRPGAVLTRQVVAVAQMCWSALLIHITGGRIETHFHIFGSLAFLAFYRDIRVIVTATVVVGADHVLRSLLWPESIFGVSTISLWRALEHAGWVVFEDIFLTISIRQSLRDMLDRAIKQADFELIHEKTEEEVRRRTVESRDAKSHLQLVFDASPLGVFVCDRQGAFLQVNEMYETISGQSSAQARSWGWSLSIHPDDRKRVLGQWRDSIRRRIGFRSVYRFQRSDGAIVWARNITKPMLNGDQLAGFVGAIEEITERKKAEDALHERALLAALTADVGVVLNQGHDLRTTLQRCAESLVHNLHVAFARVWTLNEAENVLELQASAGIYTHLNGAHARVPVGQLKIGTIAAERIPHLTNAVVGDPRVGDQEWAQREGMVAFAGYPLVFEDRLVGVMAAFSRQPLSETTLQAMSAIADAVALGIDRKRAEKQLRVAHAETVQLLAAIPSILIGLDSHNRVRKWNSAAESVFGLPASEVLGRPLEECGIAWQDAEIPARIAGLRGAETSTPLDDVAFRDAQGRDRMLGLTISPVRGDDEAAGLLLLGADVTDQKQLETQLRHAQKLESIGQLAAGIAHEINTPIQYIGDNARFLQDGFDALERLLREYDSLLLATPESQISPNELIERLEQTRQTADSEYLLSEIPQAITQTLEGVDRVATIVRAMKEFSHPGSEEKIPSDLNRCINSTVIVARNEWKYHAELVTDLAADLPLVPCYPNDFNQVILNLIVNAAHAIADAHREQPDAKGQITISTRHHGDWVEVRISDTGGGIPEAIRTRIFTPFFTTKEVGRGTGQGLTIAYSVIVDKHGGSISFESEIGQGTTFIVRLPLHGEPIAAVVEATQ